MFYKVVRPGLGPETRINQKLEAQNCLTRFKSISSKNKLNDQFAKIDEEFFSICKIFNSEMQNYVRGERLNIFFKKEKKELGRKRNAENCRKLLKQLKNENVICSTMTGKNLEKNSLNWLLDN